MKADIIIVGAGPVGSLTALTAAKKNNEILMLEQKNEIGTPEHCTGLLSINGLKNLGLANLPGSIIQNNRIKGSKFFSPNGHELIIARKEPQAIVVNRRLLDQFLAEKCEKKGVEILKGLKVHDINYLKNNNEISISIQSERNSLQKLNHKFNSFICILATGVNDRIVQNNFFKPIPKKNFLTGYQYLMEGITDLDVNFVELYLNRTITPHFFTWIIPINETTAKVGLASNEGLTINRLNYFIKKYPITKKRFTKSTIIRKFGGRLVINGLRKSFSKNGLMLVGDVAGQTKATTGGGVITGGLAGIIAGEVAIEAIKENNNSYDFLKKYDSLWKGKYLRHFKAMSFLRHTTNILDNQALNEIIKVLDEKDVIKLIAQKGDIDNQANIILSLLKNPDIIKTIPKLLRFVRL